MGNRQSFNKLIRHHQFEKALEKLDIVRTITELNPSMPHYDNIIDLLVQAGCPTSGLHRVWAKFVFLTRTPDYNGWKFWQYLASRNCDTALRELYKRHCPIEWNAQVYSGDTALHIAVQNRRYEAVQALLEADVDTTIKNRLNLTAESMGDDRIKKIFEQHRLGDTVRTMKADFDEYRRTNDERLARYEAALEDAKRELEDGKIRLSKLERVMYSVNPR